jgi:hypothetical protein
MKLVLGLVTHPKSKYGDVNFKHSISHLVLNLKMPIEIFPSDKDLSTRRIGLADIAKHYIFAIWLEGSYSNLFRVESLSKRFFLDSLHFLKKLKQVFKLLLVITFNREKKSIEVARLRRFDNINHGHLKIFEKAYKSDADSVMILEDDARVQDPAALTDALIEILNIFSRRESSVIANISLSNSAIEMGVTHLVGLSKDNDLFFESLMAFTNSASSNIYNAGFIHNFHNAWRKLVIRATNLFIPIDWILNYIIIHSVKYQTNLSTFHMRKPLVYQLSMASNQIILEKFND